jgi:hypothetical protein
MTVQVEEAVQERTYGGLRRPQSPGIGPLSLGTSVGLMGGLAIDLMLMMFIGFITGLCAAAAQVVLALPIVIKKRGRPLYSVWGSELGFRRSQASGATSYRSGLVGVTPDGRRRLPGLLAPIEVWSVPQDGQGRPFALIQIPGARQWAVCFRVDPEGGALIDVESRDLKVAGWGDLLALIGQTGGIRQVAAVIETQPDSGALLRSHTASIITADAPDFARRSAMASAEELPHGVASTIGYVTVTFSEVALGISAKGSARDRAQAAADEIGRRLPELAVALSAGGASRPRPLTSTQLSRRVREAFDPSTVVPNAEAAAAGEPPLIGWADCGPVATDETRDTYHHETAASRTYEALKLPTGTFFDRVLERLAGPIAEAPRKRVTLLYAPVDAAETAELLDRDLKTAINRASRRKGPVHAHDSADLAAAHQAAREEASGAGVVSLSVLVTVTVTDEDDLAAAATAVERAARSSRFRLSPVYGGQAAAFAGALGLGLSLSDLSFVSDSIRTHL